MNDTFEHGTHAGWNTHVRSQEQPCALCQAAHSGYMAGYREVNDMAHPAPIRCGTKAGLNSHAIAGERLCGLCDAYARGFMLAQRQEQTVSA